MLSFWKKRSQSNKKEEAPSSGKEITWDDQATGALDQAISQAPVPGMLKKRMRNELAKSAERIAQKDGRTNVTAEDLMNGLMEKLPQNMRKKVEQAAKEGPQGIEKLKKSLGK